MKKKLSSVEELTQLSPSLTISSKNVLFIQGAGDVGYKGDLMLVASLRKALGTTYNVHYPEMSTDEVPYFGSGWVKQIGEEISKIKGEIILVGHSLGASMLLKYLSENKTTENIVGIFLVAPPFWSGKEDWKQPLKLQEDFSDKLPKNIPTFFYQCKDDDVVPFGQFKLYKQNVPWAVFREIPHGGHQLNNDLSIVAKDIKSATIQQTENMDVSKHPHHVMHKKKWKEYLLEFSMLFLAVFLGFLAEDYREHKVEREREKQYASSLYDEFYSDSIVISNKIKARLSKERDCDYLNSYIKDSSLTNLPKEFYPAFTIVFFLFNSYIFEPEDGVLNQLKSSGSLRYFKNAKLQKLFGDISVTINNVRNRNEQEYQFFSNPIKPFILKHYDFNWNNDLRKISENSYNIDLLNKYLRSDTIIKAKILNLSSFDRIETANMIMFYKTMLVSSRTLQMKNYIDANTKILQALRENYNLNRVSKIMNAQ